MAFAWICEGGKLVAQDYQKKSLLMANQEILAGKPAPDTKGQRDLRKRQPTPDWRVASFISKGIYPWGLSWATSRQVDLHSCQQNPKSLMWLPSWGFCLHHNQMVSSSRGYIKACILCPTSWSERQVGPFQVQGRRSGLWNCPDPGQPSVTSSWWPPPIRKILNPILMPQ